ncbi:hypothetical protein FHG87_023639 [Trinorchestia longiramus]|nr:hypothetical protein FHG87_023639 [Trinorchestia longiramus]
MAAQSQRSLSELLQAAKQMTTKTDAALALDGLQTSGGDRLTPMEGVRDDLPRVDRSLAQLVKVGEALWPGKSGRDAARLPADHEAHA